MSGEGENDAAERITRLHEVAADLHEAADEGTVYDAIIDAAVEILGFDWCSVSTPAEGYFELRRVSEAAPLEEGERLLRLDEGVAGETFQKNETIIFASPDDHDNAKPVRDSFNSGLSVPLGDWGIFQGVAEEHEAFDEQDHEAAELLASHAVAALERIDHEQARKEKNERLEKFASVVSHDLRNPLNVAELRLDLVRNECDSEHLDDIEQALDRMEQLITDLLMLARVGDEVREVEPVSLETVATSCWETFEPESSDGSLDVETDLTLLADTSRLKQLLENLIKNALQHGGSDVTVRIGDLDDGFYVEDTGAGIPPDERDQIFESGYSTGDGGTGFGLSIVSDIVDAHGWEIAVTESTEGGVSDERSESEARETRSSPGARFEITDVTIPE